MQELQEAISLAFDAAESIADPRMGKVKLSLQQAAANAGLTEFALTLRGRLSTGLASRGTVRSGNRFNTTPPASQVFINPNSSAARENVLRAASENEVDQVLEARQESDNADAAGSVYAKIANMSPSAIVSTYGESAIEGMIRAKNGDLAEVDGKKPNQKAAYLKSLCANEGV